MSDLGTQTSLKTLLATTVADLQRLIKAQVDLAKAELAGSTQAAAKTGVILTAAILLAGLAGIFALVTIAYVLVALGPPVWAGFGIVTVVLFLIAVVLGLISRSSAKKIKGPERTIAEIAKTKAALSSSGPADPSLPPGSSH